MFSGLTLVTPPAAPPVTLADVKAHSRIGGCASDEDPLLAGYITSATRWCEEESGYAFMPQAWRLALSHFPGRNPRTGFQSGGPAEYLKWNHIEIPKPPLRSIDAFTYTDTMGNIFPMTQGYGNEVGNYLLDTECEPGRVVLPFSGIWPTTILLPGSPIKITFECGYPSFAGKLTYADGAGTWVSGDKFDLGLAGSWISIAGNSCVVASVTDDQHLQIIPSADLAQLGSASLDYAANRVPMHYRHAVLYLVAHAYETREPIVVGRGIQAVEVRLTLDSLLGIDKIYRT